MPDRIIRDELLRSPRYRNLSSDTVRLLFLHLLLCVDNLGNLEAFPVTVADVLHRPVDPETAAKLLAELADADLIRMYSVDGKPYLHVPRFRQRLRYPTSKHPRPPPMIECKEISQILPKVRRSQGEAPTKPAEVKRSKALYIGTVGVIGTVPKAEPVDNLDELKIDTSKPIDRPSTSTPTAPASVADLDRQRSNLAATLELAKLDTDAKLLRKAQELGLALTSGQTFASIRARVFAVLVERATNEPNTREPPVTASD